MSDSPETRPSQHPAIPTSDTSAGEGNEYTSLRMGQIVDAVVKHLTSSQPGLSVGQEVQEDQPPLEATSARMRLHTRLAYSIQEAAELLGVSEKSVRRLIARGLLRPSRALRHILIPRAEIERFLEDTSR